MPATPTNNLFIYDDGNGLLALVPAPDQATADALAASLPGAVAPDPLAHAGQALGPLTPAGWLDLSLGYVLMDGPRPPDLFPDENNGGNVPLGFGAPLQVLTPKVNVYRTRRVRLDFAKPAGPRRSYKVDSNWVTIDTFEYVPIGGSTPTARDYIAYIFREPTAPKTPRVYHVFMDLRDLALQPIPGGDYYCWRRDTTGDKFVDGAREFAGVPSPYFNDDKIPGLVAVDLPAQA